MKALVVDDSRTMRSILARILGDLGIDVEQAVDGKAALERLIAGDLPDIALVDWHMPNMTGIELLNEIRHRPELSRVRVLMVTSESEPDQIGIALDAGANEYLIKPFTPDAIAGKLEMIGLGEGSTATTTW